MRQVSRRKLMAGTAAVLTATAVPAQQFLARATNDHAVVAAARSYQEVTDWHRRHPS